MQKDQIKASKLLNKNTMATKRRRISADTAPRCSISSISDLPNEPLQHIASFLVKPSRVLLALAIDAQDRLSSALTSAIVGDQWDTLDFGEIERKLAANLSDEHINAILVRIDAVNRVKKLKLTNCINITGAGLGPLSESSIIEQIDLSLVGDHEHYRSNFRPLISCRPQDHVLPILDSIFEREGCSLRNLRFPSVWWTGGRFEQLLRRYSELLTNHGVSCLKCNVNLPPENESWIDSSGNQKYTCYKCLKHYCRKCTRPDDIYVDDPYMLGYCDNCEKRVCIDCEQMQRCTRCEKSFCVGCKPFTKCSGDGCDDYLCEECVSLGYADEKCCKCEGRFCHMCDDQMESYCSICERYCCNDCQQKHYKDIFAWRYCDYCNDGICDDCNKKKGIDGINAIQICNVCNTCCCNDCRVESLQHEQQTCNECMKLAGPFLLEEHTRLRKENTELKAEISGLKD